MEIYKEFSFEAAHSLPNVHEGHHCGRIHGHSFQVQVAVSGEIGAESGWIIDFADLDRAIDPVRRELDHNHLNEIDGLENPTLENMVLWIWRKLKPDVPGLARVTLRRDGCAEGCDYRGELE